MTEHYYTKSPAVEHDRFRFDAVIRGMSFRFISDAGVFSRQGVDFGSKLLAESIQIPTDAKVLDVGCGYGPIGLVAAKLAEAGTVTMIDINERAVSLAKENAALNGIRNVTALQSDRLQQVRNERFTHVVTNPPIRAGKETIFAIYEEAERCLNPGGELWVVIQKKQGAPSTWTKLQTLFSQVEDNLQFSFLKWI